MIKSKKIFEDKLYLYIDTDHIFEGSLAKTAENILNIEKRLKTENDYVIKNPDMYSYFKVKLEREYYEEQYEIKIYGVRTETDEEYENRIAKEKIAYEKRKISLKKTNAIKKQKLEKREIETLKKLQKKYKGILNRDMIKIKD